MVTRLLGKKLGMTRVFNEKGRSYPVTVIEAGPCTVLQLKTEKRDGYNAVQLGYGARAAKNVSRAELGHLVPPQENQKPEDRKKQVGHEIKTNLKTSPALVREVPWDGKEALKVGDTVNVSVFENMKRVDVVGTSKGRGFMGVVRRWGFHGLPATHGQSDRERAPGSLGRQHSISQGVYPGKRMGGHWGVERVTAQNLEVVKIVKEKNLLFVHGAVPGPMGGHVLVKESHWVPPKPPTVTSKKQHGKAGAKK